MQAAVTAKNEAFAVTRGHRTGCHKRVTDAVVELVGQPPQLRCDAAPDE